MKVDAPPEKTGSNTGANRLFHREIVRTKPQLFRAILTFNRSIHVKTIDHKFYSGLSSESGSPGITGYEDKPHGTSMVKVHNMLKASNRAKARFFTNESLGFWDFEEESRRMVLLDAATLNKLIFTWGAAFCAPLLNQFILKQDVELLDQEVGRPYVDFARGMGRFNIGNIHEIIPPPPKTLPPSKMRSLIIGYGMQAHAICSAAWPLSLQTFENQRLERELPELFKHRFDLVQVAPPHPSTVWLSMKKILLKEVAPQWIPCFS